MDTISHQPTHPPTQPPLHINQDCRDAAAALDTGEMITLPGFSLFEAMSALELMDPKMDESLLEV